MLTVGSVLTISSQAQLFKMFQAYDSDGSGSMTRDEFEAICQDLDMFIPGRDLPSELLQSYDKNRSGSLSYDQFVSSVLQLEAGLLSAPEVTADYWLPCVLKY